MDRCKVKFVMNPNAQPGFAIEFLYGEKRCAKVTIKGRDIREILDIADNAHKELFLYGPFEVYIDRKNAPTLVRESPDVINRLVSLFSGVKGGNAQSGVTWEIIDFYVSTYGKSPDFSKYAIPKHAAKIRNYISSVIGTKISDERMIELMKERYG